MKIIADNQIPLVQQAFSNIGDVTLYDGRTLTSRQVADADVLIVRSVTAVNSSLLENSTVRFVATATSGIDHVDTEYLRCNGIGFASAHGSNAQSVVEYVLSCIFVLAGQYGFDPFKKSIGIIGCGMIGSKLMSICKTLGMECLVNDPPLKDKTGDPVYRDLPGIMNADIITLHVPLTEDDLYPTRHMVDEKFLAAIKEDAILINTSRGHVVSERALKVQIEKCRQFSAVVDVWENEPDIDLELLKEIEIGTPHIAGYSLDAKVKATKMVHEQICRYFDIQQVWNPADDCSNTRLLEIRLDSTLNDQEAIQTAVLSHYDVSNDAALFRRVLEIGKGRAGFYFDELRRNYPVRRNFQATTISLPAGRSILAEILKSLGFNIIRHQA